MLQSKIKIYPTRVFADKHDNFGERHVITIDEGKQLSDKARQEISAKLGLSETIFINNVKNSDINFYSLTGNIPFAGSAALAAAVFLHRLSGKPIDSLTSQGDKFKVWIEDNCYWVNCQTKLLPDWNLLNMNDSKQVDILTLDQSKEYKHTMVWSWLDKAEALVRARTFAADWGLNEVEANGSGTMLLANKLKQPVTVKHGEGSVIYARQEEPEVSSVGGRVVFENVSEILVD